MTLKYGARSTGDMTLKNQLYDQLLHLIDIILDGRKCYLESIRGTEKFDILFQQYETERHAIIEPFCKSAVSRTICQISHIWAPCLIMALLFRMSVSLICFGLSLNVVLERFIFCFSGGWGIWKSCHLSREVLWFPNLGSNMWIDWQQWETEPVHGEVFWAGKFITLQCYLLCWTCLWEAKLRRK